MNQPMSQKPVKSGPMLRLFFVLKWIILPLALVTILPLAALTIYEMNREVPIPKSFQRSEVEQTSRSGVQDMAALPDESLAEGRSSGSVPSAGSVPAQTISADEDADIPEFYSEPLIPTSDDMPDKVDVDELQKLNEAFSDMERRYAEYESNKDNYSFGEAFDYLLPLYREALMFVIDLKNKRSMRFLRRSDEGRSAADAADERAMRFFQKFDPTFVELGIRTEVWDVAAMFSKEWDEKVYYYRKCGPVKGSIHITIQLAMRGLGRAVEGIRSSIDSIRQD